MAASGLCRNHLLISSSRFAEKSDSLSGILGPCSFRATKTLGKKMASVNKAGSPPRRRSAAILASSFDFSKERKLTSDPAISKLITKEECLELYENLVLVRDFEDKCEEMYRGRDGISHHYNGQEAVSTGFIKLLKHKDCVISTYREDIHALSKGVPVRHVMSELFGKTSDEGRSMHIYSKEHNLLGEFEFIREAIPVGTWAAVTSKYKREVLKEDCDEVTIVFFGNGNYFDGQFSECLNMAALWKLPIVFVAENNLWSIGTSPMRDDASVPKISKKPLPDFGMPSVDVDGMDVLKVREVAKEAVARARRGEGPTLVECETYRSTAHSLLDPDQLSEPTPYMKKDPINALKKYIMENNLATEAELKAIDHKIYEVVEDAVEFARKIPFPPGSRYLEYLKNGILSSRGFGIGLDRT